MKKYEEKKKLMVEDYMLDKVLGKIKMIMGTKKIDDTKNLMKADVKLPDDITLKKFWY